MHTHSIVTNKKGVSVIEMLGYIILMGTVFSLLASTTYFIGTSAQKMKEKSNLNLASTELYTSFLSTMNGTIMPDTIVVDDGSDPEKNTGTSVSFKKTKYYTSDGDEITDYSTPINGEGSKPINETINTITYSYDSDNKAINTIRSNCFNSSVSATSSLDIQFVNVDSFTFTRFVISKTISYVQFTGTLSLKNNAKATSDFNFVIPVYTIINIE